MPPLTAYIQHIRAGRPAMVTTLPDRPFPRRAWLRARFHAARGCVMHGAALACWCPQALLRAALHCLSGAASTYIPTLIVPAIRRLGRRALAHLDHAHLRSHPEEPRGLPPTPLLMEEPAHCVLLIPAARKHEWRSVLIPTHASPARACTVRALCDLAKRGTHGTHACSGFLDGG